MDTGGDQGDTCPGDGDHVDSVDDDIWSPDATLAFNQTRTRT